MKRNKNASKALAFALAGSLAASSPLSYVGGAFSLTAFAQEVKNYAPLAYTQDMVIPMTDEAQIEKTVNALVRAMTEDEKWGFLALTGTGSEGNAGDLPGVARLGVPRIKMYDGPAGLLYLYETRNVTLQVAGSDQWGNITSGIELIRKKLDKTAYGMVAPLVTDSTGKKFGKTEGNALWLDINKTSSYQMYQYLINLEDSMIIEYLKKLTFIEPAEIEEIAKQHAEAPHLRIAQKRLAKEIITDIHGEEEFKKAVEISEAFFSGNFRNLSKQQLKDAFQDMPVAQVEEGTPLVDALVNSHIASSKREAREFIKNGSISINGDRCTDLEKVLTKQDTLDGETVIIRKGKKNYFILKV